MVKNTHTQADLHPLTIKSKPTVGKYSIYGTYMNIWDTYSRDTTGWQPKSSKPGPSVPTGFGADGTTGRISAAAVEMGVANTPCIVGVTRGYWYWCLLVGCCVLKGLCDSLKWRDGGLKDQVVKPFLRLKDVFLDASNGLKTCEVIYQHHDLSTHDPPLYCAFFVARLISARSFSSICMVDMVVFRKASPTVHSKLPAFCGWQWLSSFA